MIILIILLTHIFLNYFTLNEAGAPILVIYSHRVLRGLAISGYLIKLKDRNIIKKNPFPLWFLIYAIISLIWTNSVIDGIRIILYITLLFGFYYICMDLAEHDHLKDAMKVLLINCVITLIYFSLFGEYVEGTNSSGMEIDSRGDRFSINGSFNVMAGVLAIFTGFSLSIISEKQLPSIIKIVSFVIMVMSMILLLLSLSRSAVIGVGLLFLIFATIKRNWVYLGIILGIGLFFLFYSEISRELIGNFHGFFDAIKKGDILSATDAYQTLSSRVLLWDDAINSLTTIWSFFIGRGAGTVEHWVQTNTDIVIIHSDILGIFLDFGLIGCLILFASFYTMLKQGWSLAAGGSNPWARAIGLAAIISITATIPKFIWDIVFLSPSGYLLVAICGLAGGVNQMHQTKKKQANQRMIMKTKF